MDTLVRLCGCGRLAKLGGKKCQFCLDSSRRVRNRYKESGLCTCGHLKEIGKSKCRKCLDVQLKWAKENPNRFAAIQRKKMYGISDDEYQNLLIKSNNKCAICEEEFVKTPSIDHDHNTGKIRGLLCSNCNFLIGHCKEDIDILDNAIRYLRKA